MTQNVYDLGDLVTLTGRFFSDAALTVPADPSTVVLSIRDPARVVTTPTATRASVGVWTYSWLPAASGLYEIRWEGTGAVVAAEQEAIFVRVGITLGADLCSLAEVRQEIKINTTAVDDKIQTSITAASFAISKRYQRQFSPAGSQTYLFDVTSRLVDLAPFDLQPTPAPTLTLDPGGDNETVLDATDYRLRPIHSLSGTYYRLRLRRGLWLPSMGDFGFALLQIDGTWGFPSIDPDVRRAAIVTAASWVDRGAESYAMPNMDTDGPNPYPARPETWAIPSAAHSLLQRYERMVAA
jgi:hypothetical protein